MYHFLMRTGRRKERRRGPDLVVRSVQACIVGCLLLLVAALLLVDTAKPRMETFFDRLFGISLRRYWDIKLISLNFRVLVIMFSCSSVGLLANLARLRRRYDELSLTLTVSWWLSALGIAAYLWLDPGLRRTLMTWSW